MDDIKLEKVDLEALNFERIEKDKDLELESLEDSYRDENQFITVELNEEEFSKGNAKGSYYAGFLSAIMQVGVPSELAVDVLINHETIEHNLKIKKNDDVDVESIIEDELQKL